MTKAPIPLLIAFAAGLIGSAVCNSRAADQEVQNFGARMPSREELINALIPEGPREGEAPRTRGIRPVEAAKRKTVALQVTFGINSATLTPEAKQTLDEVGAALTSDKLRDYRFQLEGHTDSKGSSGYNQRLSERRAESVAHYLADRFQMPAERLKTVGKGESEPLAGRSPEDPDNRRVQIVNLGH